MEYLPITLDTTLRKKALRSPQQSLLIDALKPVMGLTAAGKKPEPPLLKNFQSWTLTSHFMI
ncbi:AMP-binding protein [Xenorhabdus ishibashii]|uniref:AMP-binding protein n=1 Tax=Xenorhabdus ishibashii TaxID=1034471 RepID=A0A2D0KC20_9GAMM|nr:AMP-binding protein [Xenorhabdus ishibashii]